MHPLFEKAFEFINATDLANAADGKFDIGEGLKAIFSNNAGIQLQHLFQNLNVIIIISTFNYVLMVWKPLAGNQEKNVKHPNGDYNH